MADEKKSWYDEPRPSKKAAPPASKKPGMTTEEMRPRLVEWMLYAMSDDVPEDRRAIRYELVYDHPLDGDREICPFYMCKAPEGLKRLNPRERQDKSERATDKFLQACEAEISGSTRPVAKFYVRAYASPEREAFAVDTLPMTLKCEAVHEESVGLEDPSDGGARELARHAEVLIREFPRVMTAQTEAMDRVGDMFDRVMARLASREDMAWQRVDAADARAAAADSRLNQALNEQQFRTIAAANADFDLQLKKMAMEIIGTKIFPIVLEKLGLSPGGMLMKQIAENPDTAAGILALAPPEAKRQVKMVLDHYSQLAEPPAVNLKVMHTAIDEPEYSPEEPVH